MRIIRGLQNTTYKVRLMEFDYSIQRKKLQKTDIEEKRNNSYIFPLWGGQKVSSLSCKQVKFRLDFKTV